MVIGSWLAPAHVPPVTEPGAGVHGAEVAHRTTASANECGPGVGVGPCVTSVGGAVHLVISVSAAAGNTTTATVFVHTGEVHVTRDQVTGNLHVANERSGNLSLVGPGQTVISGVADEKCAPTNIEVVP
jgi:hypothetical protein